MITFTFDGRCGFVVNRVLFVLSIGLFVGGGLDETVVVLLVMLLLGLLCCCSLEFHLPFVGSAS